MGIRYENFYYVKLLEKCEIALIDIFNNIKINKYTDITRTTVAKSLVVPVVTTYEKNFANWYQNQQAAKKLMPLPIMGLRLKGFTQNSKGRTQSTYLRAIFSKATDQWINDIQPTPYFANYSLSYLCDNRSDLDQFIENILPYFNPQRCLRIKEWDWIPDEERKFQVELLSTDLDWKDETKNESEHRYITVKIEFRLEIDFLRPFEIADLIKYAEINVNIDNIIDKQQAIIYPTDLIDSFKHPFEEIANSIVRGYSILKTMCKTLLKQVDLNGNITYEDVSAPACTSPVNVPDIKQIDLWFDVDANQEPDHSPYERDFTLLPLATRTFIPGFSPGNGEDVGAGGYEVDSTIGWNQILSWFGTNNGLNETPFTFRIKCQFDVNNETDIIFQQLKNKETGNIPAGSVYFEWGLMLGKVYFSFATYGTSALSYTFQTISTLTLNNVDSYTFVFALYDQGSSGLFGYSINDGPTITLPTERL